MTTPRLPGLNYGTPLKIDDLDYLERTYTDEFVRRIRAVVGSYRLSGPSLGIFSEYDPINASDTSDPFFVERNAIDGMTVDVYPGDGLVESGMIVLLTAKVERLAMVNQEVGQQNVVFVEYQVIPDDDTVVQTRFNTSEATQTMRPPDQSSDPADIVTLQVASIQDWNNAVLFPPDRKKNILPLALTTITTKTDSPFKEVTVDLARTTLTTNRPWFSPVDMAHRSEQGTGSSSVPHSLGLNDLSQGDLTLYDQLLNYGMVLGRDRDAPGVPGIVCLETVTPARIETDTTGEITGTLSQMFVQLTRYPIRLLGAWSVTDQDNEILVELIPHTNILTFSQKEGIPSQGFRIQYAAVSAGEPAVNSLVNDEIHVRQPVATRELVISGGKGYSSIEPKFTDNFGNEWARLSLSTSAAIPKRYRVFIDQNGQLVHTPQHILCSTRLDDLGTSAYNFNVSLLGSARIRVGLSNVTLVPATVVRVRITGTDANGSSIYEDLEFNFSNYQLPVIGNCEENPKNFQVTSTVFTGVTSLMVLSRVSDGPNGVVMVYADQDPMVAEDLRDVCPLAEVFWDGEGICRIRDIRPVSSRLEVPSRSHYIETAAQSLITALSSQGYQAVELLGEDLRDPYHFRLSDPLRFFKFGDGLRSSVSPEQPGIESLGERLDQDIYTSQALRLVPGASRSIRLTLVGRDADVYWLNGQDGSIPVVEFRTAPEIDPDGWTDWTQVDPETYGNGCNFILPIQDNDSFKIQIRVKGRVSGILGIQYWDDGSSSLVTTDNAFHDIQSWFVPEEKALSIEATVQGIQSTSAQAGVFKAILLARRAVGGNVTVVAGSGAVHTIQDGAWVIQAVPDVGNQKIVLQVKGAAGTEVHWTVNNIKTTWVQA